MGIYLGPLWLYNRVRGLFRNHFEEIQGPEPSSLQSAEERQKLRSELDEIQCKPSQEWPGVAGFQMFRFLNGMSY